MENEFYGMHSFNHLLWLPAGALVGFAASFLFGNIPWLPVDLYYLVYFIMVLAFLAAYVRFTSLNWREWVSWRLGWGIAAGVLVGLLMAGNVLSRPPTDKMHGGMLAWGIFWRGLVYGAVDGLLLLAFPWLVVWRATGATRRSWLGKAGAASLAWAAILFITAVYHLGYPDFRSSKVRQPLIGSTIASLPTLATAHPAASVLAHVFMHVAAVIHSPYTDLYLPPHREARTDESRE